MFAPYDYIQLRVAAQNGHADDIIALVAEGANVECKDWVRSLVFRFDELIARLSA
jgi:hypothetical protein